MNQSVLFLSIFVFICMLSLVICLVISSSFPEFLVGATVLATSRHPLSLIPLGTGSWISRHRLMGMRGDTVSLYICKYTFFPLFISYIWYKYTLMGFRKYRSYRPSSTAFISCLQNFSTDEKGLATPRYRTWYGCEWLVLKSRGKAQIPTLKELDGLISETHTAQFGPLRHPSSDLFRFSWPRIKY